MCDLHGLQRLGSTFPLSLLLLLLDQDLSLHLPGLPLGRALGAVLGARLQHLVLLLLGAGRLLRGRLLLLLLLVRLAAAAASAWRGVREPELVRQLAGLDAQQPLTPPPRPALAGGRPAARPAPRHRPPPRPPGTCNTTQDSRRQHTDMTHRSLEAGQS